MILKGESKEGEKEKEEAKSSRRAVKTNHWLSVGVGGFISKRHVIMHVEIYIILHIPQNGVLVNVSTVKTFL